MASDQQNYDLDSGGEIRTDIIIDGVIREKCIIYYSSIEDNERHESKVTRETSLIDGLRTSYFIPIHKYEPYDDRMEIIYDKYDFSLRRLIEDLSEQNKQLSELGAMLIFITILKGLFTLHSLELIHRKLSVDSIFFKKTGEIAIGNLHNIRQIEKKTPMTFTYKTKNVYDAPELSMPGYTQTVDSWSLGLILNDLSDPNMTNPQQISDYICKKSRNFRSNAKFIFDPRLDKYLMLLTQRDGTKRISVSELINEPYIVQLILRCRDVKLYINDDYNPDCIMNINSKPTTFLIGELPDINSQDTLLKSFKKGQYGNATRVKKNNFVFVRKSMNISDLQSMGEKITDGINEDRFSRNLYHDNIITTIKSLSKVNDGFYHIYLENCEDDLENFLEKNKKLSPLAVHKILCSILNGLYHIHNLHLIHRDLKPANILITKNGSIVISDLGLMIKSDDENRQFNVGTPCYMAPEVFSFDESKLPDYDEKSDIYSVGCILYQICTSKSPPPIDGYFMKGDDENRWKLDTHLYSQDLQRLLNRMMKMNPKDRISIQELFLDEFIIKINYETKYIPFFIDGKLNPKLNDKFKITEPKTNPDVDFIKILIFKEPIRKDGKYLDDRSLDYVDIKEDIINIFPDINLFKSKDSTKLRIDVFINVVENVMKALGFVLSVRGGTYQFRQICNVILWGENNYVIYGLRNMFQIIQFLYERDKTPARQNLKNLSRSLYMFLATIFVNNPSIASQKSKILPIWIDAVADGDPTEIQLIQSTMSRK